MTELHINIEVQSGKTAELERVFREVFVPAIRIQEGFMAVSLLKQADTESAYVIQLSFESEEQRQKWVDSQEHQRAFPLIAELCAEKQGVRYEVLASQR